MILEGEYYKMICIYKIRCFLLKIIVTGLRVLQLSIISLDTRWRLLLDHLRCVLEISFKKNNNEVTELTVLCVPFSPRMITIHLFLAVKTGVAICTFYGSSFQSSYFNCTKQLVLLLDIEN